MREKRGRTFLRTLTWRVIGIVLLFAMGYLAGGEPVSAAGVAVGYNLLRWAMHYAHERAWLRVGWGKTENTEREEVSMTEAQINAEFTNLDTRLKEHEIWLLRHDRALDAVDKRVSDAFNRLDVLEAGR